MMTLLLGCRVVMLILPSFPFADIFNGCMDAAIFPEALKVANTVPVYKKGNPCKLGNYMPISVIPVFKKIFETIIKRQLGDFFRRTSCSIRPNMVFVRGDPPHLHCYIWPRR